VLPAFGSSHRVAAFGSSRPYTRSRLRPHFATAKIKKSYKKSYKKSSRHTTGDCFFFIIDFWEK
jgi:hypothetical protein